MTNRETLEKAIQKAIDGGWEYPFGANGYEIKQYVKARPEVIAFGFKEDWQEGYHLEGHWSIPELIFNHDFAKALWGNEKTDTEGRTQEEFYRKKQLGEFAPGSWGYHNIKWQYHLQQMVIAEDPIKYLGENM